MQSESERMKFLCRSPVRNFQFRTGLRHCVLVHFGTCLRGGDGRFLLEDRWEGTVAYVAPLALGPAVATDVVAAAHIAASGFSPCTQASITVTQTLVRAQQQRTNTSIHHSLPQLTR